MDDVMEPALTAKGLTRRYHGRTVLEDLTLSVSAGEVVGLLGPNGAGKSTGFGIIAGVVKPHAGAVSLNGVALCGLPLWKRVTMGLGFLAQEPSVVRNMTVDANLALAVADDDERMRLLDQFGLLPLARTQAGSLSGGERRRLEIVRCLSQEPQVILMDEPFSGVDPVSVESLQGVIRGLAMQGVGVLVSDHSVQATLGVCDRAVILDEGRVMASGAPSIIVQNDVVRSRYLGDGFVFRGAPERG